MWGGRAEEAGGSRSAQPPVGLGSVPACEGSGGAEGSRGGPCGLLARFGGVLLGDGPGTAAPGPGKGLLRRAPLRALLRGTGARPQHPVRAAFGLFN